MEQFIEAFDNAVDARECAITFLPHGFTESCENGNYILYDAAKDDHSMWYFYEPVGGAWVLYECFYRDASVLIADDGRFSLDGGETWF